MRGRFYVLGNALRSAAPDLKAPIGLLPTMSVSSRILLFEEWAACSWETLRARIESDETLRIVDETDEVCIIRYDKGAGPAHPWTRSVVWDKRRNVPLSVAPPKASVECPYEAWTCAAAKEAIERGELSVETYEDGFMIQVYRAVDGQPRAFEIASRSRRGASGTFYTAKSLATLFQEAYGAQESPAEESPAEGTVAQFWSYVVQHPEHRVVQPFTTPRVVLVQRGVVSASGAVTVWDGFPAVSTELPASEESLGDYLRQRIQQQPWWYRGVVIKDATGQRWRIRSEKYMAIRSLRGNESSVYERFARLFTQNLTAIYYEYYPEDMIPFSLCGVFMNDVIHRLHQWYVGLYVRRDLAFSQIHRVYRPHLYALHGVYLSALRPVGRRVTDQDIRVYLMGQPPGRIAFLIRQHQEAYHSRPVAV